MYDLKQIKQKISCITYLNQHGYNIQPGKRTVSPLREGARNPTSFFCDNDFWYDFGSGEGGDVIDLAARLKHSGNKGRAIRELALSIGLQSENARPDNVWSDDIQELCNRRAFYHSRLTPADYQYLAERGFTPEDSDRLMIGRVTDGYLKGRLFLPYFKNGAVVYYATRAMPDSRFSDNKYMKASLDECPSYENIPWGLQTLNRGKDLLVISEGYFDRISWEKDGYSVLSPITGRFSTAQWGLVISACKRFKRVLIIFDNDPVSHAGAKFTHDTAMMLFRNRINFSVATTPENIKDVNDYYAAGGKLSTLVDSSMDGMLFLASQCKNMEELENFILSINRYVNGVKIASLLSNPVLTERFTSQELKRLKALSNKAPVESVIVDEIILQKKIIYVDQVGFYEWNGKIWNHITDATVKNYADTAYGKIFTTAQRTNNVCQLLKARTVRDIQFDRQPVLTFQNGTLEIDTGIFRSHSQADYCSIIMDYDYDPNRQCPEWVHFIDDVTAGEPHRQEILQFIRGYTLFPNCIHQKVFLLIGSGGNGKSVYLEILQRLFGDKNVTHIEPNGLTREFQRIRLKDSLLNIGSDINNDFARGEIREWLLKIADGTSIQACYKGMTHIDFIPRCKLVYACNAIPTAELVNGLNRRMQFVNFPCRYVEYPDPNNPYEKPRDINLMQKLIRELPGIFLWRYSGYKLLKTVGYFSDRPEQTQFLTQFEAVSNPVSSFVDDYTDTFTGTVPRDTVYQLYTEWCQTTGHKPLARERFIPKFREAAENMIEDEAQPRIDGKRVRIFIFKNGTGDTGVAQVKHD